MKNWLELALAGALAVGSAPSTTPAATAGAGLDLATATGQTSFGTYYCEKLHDRCDGGDNAACALYAKNCTD